MGRPRSSKPGAATLGRGGVSLGKGSFVRYALMSTGAVVLFFGAWKLALSVFPSETIYIEPLASRKPVCDCPATINSFEEDFTAAMKEGKAGDTGGGGFLSTVPVNLTCDTLDVCKTATHEPRCGIVYACDRALFCGDCAFPDWCGGGGRKNFCGCTPRTCQSLERSCGEAPNGCGGMLSCGPPCSPWVLDPASGKKPPEPKRPYRIGHFSNSAQHQKGDLRVVPEDVDTSLFSHVIFTSAGINKESLTVQGLQWNDDEGKGAGKGSWRKISSKCRETATVPMISIGGWTFTSSEDGKDVLKRLVTIPEDRAKFVANLVNWMEKYDFQGLEFDWQYPDRDVLNGYLELLSDIRKAFDKLGEKTGWRYWLSVRGPPGPGFSDAIYPDKAALARHVDWVLVLTTALRMYNKEKGITETGAAAPLRDTKGNPSVATSLEHWQKTGVPPEKIVMQVATFAVVWKLVPGAVPMYGAQAEGGGAKDGGNFISYGELLKVFQGPLAVRGTFHTPTSTVSAHMSDRWASYEDGRTVNMKIDLVVQKSLGGYALSIDQDYNGTLSRIASHRVRPSPVEVYEDKGKVMLVSAGPSKPCGSQQGTMLVTRALKNKVDYVQRNNNWTVMWSQGPLAPKDAGPFSKPGLLKTLYQAHPDVEWFVWMDYDIVFTDMSYKLPITSYRWHDLVIAGKKSCVYDEVREGKVEWNCINTGMFLLRRTEWSLKLLNDWLSLTQPDKADQSREAFNKVQVGKPRAEKSDEQSALLYLLQNDKEGRGRKTYFDGSGKLHGYWEPLVENLEDYAAKAGPGHVWASQAVPPFITHFEDCKVCEGLGLGDKMVRCFKSMDRTLNFADNQVLVDYKMAHLDLSSPAVVPID